MQSYPDGFPDNGLVDFNNLPPDEPVSVVFSDPVIKPLGEQTPIDGQLWSEPGEWQPSARPKQRPYVHRAPFVGRNDRCPCGSGVKWKKCCREQTYKELR